MCGKNFGESLFAQNFAKGVFFFYKAFGAVMNILGALVLGLQHTIYSLRQISSS